MHTINTNNKIWDNTTSPQTTYFHGFRFHFIANASRTSQIFRTWNVGNLFRVITEWGFFREKSAERETDHSAVQASSSLAVLHTGQFCSSFWVFSVFSRYPDKGIYLLLGEIFFFETARDHSTDQLKSNERCLGYKMWNMKSLLSSELQVWNCWILCWGSA